MASKPITRATIFRFPGGAERESLPEVTLPLPTTTASPMRAAQHGAVLDLAGKPKVWFTIGRGRIGKTTLLRWAAEMGEANEGRVICAAADPVNRSLRVYLDGVAEPPTNDAADVAQWLQELLLFALQEKMSALVDLGGGDTSLHRLLGTMPDLASVMEEEGVSPVAVHVIGSDPHDLVPLATTEAAGFRPAATMLVLNQMTGRPDRFSDVIRHSAFQAALGRGAVQVWMPLLTPDAARAVDARHLHFTQVGNTLGPFIGASVRAWLKAMSDEFSPVKSWLP